MRNKGKAEEKQEGGGMEIFIFIFSCLRVAFVCILCFPFLLLTVMAVWKNGVKNPLKKSKEKSEKLFSFINANGEAPCCCLPSTHTDPLSQQRKLKK